MTVENRWQQIARLNEEEPNNVVAGELLPLEWKHPDYLHLLALANWGLEESIKVGRNYRHQKAVEDTVLALAEWEPEHALEFIQGTPPDSSFQLAASMDPLEAARVVLESIMSRVVATSPTLSSE